MSYYSAAVSTYRFFLRHPVASVIALTAAVSLFPAPADAADTKTCGIFPPPFEINREDIPARLGIEHPFVPAGYVDIPVLNTGCALIPKEARVIASVLNGRPIKITVRGMMADGRGVDSFNAFVTKHIGALPEDMRTRPESERFNGIYAHWRRDSYEAIYSVQLDSRASGTYLAQLTMVSLSEEDRSGLEQHYANAETAADIPDAERRAVPTYSGKKLPTHASDQ